jgi:hypothetical protein
MTDRIASPDMLESRRWGLSDERSPTFDKICHALLLNVRTDVSIADGVPTFKRETIYAVNAEIPPSVASGLRIS